MNSVLSRTKNYVKNIFKNNFIKSIIMISSGTAFAQVVGMLASPIITRIYPPDEYGMLTLFNSVMAVVGLVGSLKYELTIPIVEDDTDAINSLSLSFFILFFFSLITTTILLIFKESILRLIGAERLLSYWYLIPIGILLTQTYRILTQFAYRNKDFKNITKTMGIQSLVGNVLKIITGSLGFGVIGLLSSKILSESLGATTLAKPLYSVKDIRDKVSIRRMKWIAKRYIKFPLYQFPSTLVGQFSVNIPVFFLGFLYNSQVVGAFGLANTIVRLPMNLIGRSVSNVFFAEAASIGNSNPDRLKSLSDKLFIRLIFIGLLPLLALLLFGPFMFSFVFGDSWVEAGNFARILSILVFAEFIFSPVSRVFEIYEKQQQILNLNIVKVVLSTVAFGVAHFLSLSQYMTVFLYTIAMSIAYALTYTLAQKYINEAINKKNEL